MYIDILFILLLFVFIYCRLYLKKKRKKKKLDLPDAKSMADTEVTTEVIESPEAFFYNLVQLLDMASLENVFHLAEEGS